MAFLCENFDHVVWVEDQIRPEDRTHDSLTRAIIGPDHGATTWSLVEFFMHGRQALSSYDHLIQTSQLDKVRLDPEPSRHEGDPTWFPESDNGPMCEPVATFLFDLHRYIQFIREAHPWDDKMGEGITRDEIDPVVDRAALFMFLAELWGASRKRAFNLLRQVFDRDADPFPDQIKYDSYMTAPPTNEVLVSALGIDPETDQWETWILEKWDNALEVDLMGFIQNWLFERMEDLQLVSSTAVTKVMSQDQGELIREYADTFDINPDVSLKLSEHAVHGNEGLGREENVDFEPVYTVDDRKVAVTGMDDRVYTPLKFDLILTTLHYELLSVEHRHTVTLHDDPPAFARKADNTGFTEVISGVGEEEVMVKTGSEARDEIEEDLGETLEDSDDIDQYLGGVDIPALSESGPKRPAQSDPEPDSKLEQIWDAPGEEMIWDLQNSSIGARWLFDGDYQPNRNKAFNPDDQPGGLAGDESSKLEKLVQSDKTSSDDDFSEDKPESPTPDEDEGSIQFETRVQTRISIDRDTFLDELDEYLAFILPDILLDDFSSPDEEARFLRVTSSELTSMELEDESVVFTLECDQDDQTVIREMVGETSESNDGAEVDKDSVGHSSENAPGDSNSADDAETSACGQKMRHPSSIYDGYNQDEIQKMKVMWEDEIPDDIQNDS